MGVVNSAYSLTQKELLPAPCYFFHGVPKSGTTWLSTLLRESAKFNCLDPVQKTGSKTCLDVSREAADPHGCPSFSKHSTDVKSAKKGTGKLIFIFRDTRDVLCSHYHWANHGHKNISSFVHDPKYGIELVIKEQNEMMHLAEQFHLASRSTLTYYEELKNDTVGELSRITSFLQMPLSQSQIETVVDSASFEAMREQEVEGEMKLKVHPNSAQALQIAKKKGKGADELFGVMTRKGEVGGYTDELDAALVVFVEAKMAQLLNHKLRKRYHGQSQTKILM